MREAGVSARLLDWYDAHARQMPWRTGPAEKAAGALPDPYHVWLSEVMLQQTTVAAVRDRFIRFLARWPTVAALAEAPDAAVMGEWAGLGYYARARNLLKCARAVAQDHSGHFPQTEAGLLSLPGIGPYTAAAVAAIAFDQPAAVVDGNVERVVARLFALETPLPEVKPQMRALAARLTPQHRPGDHAQAMMDLGATICTPRSPACGICPLMDMCQGRALGIAAELPRRAAKSAKPVRHGKLWLARRSDGAVLLETRPEKGLLGGMLAFPTTGWDGSDHPPPLDLDWQTLGEVRHTFTHFHLILSVQVGMSDEAVPQRGAFMPRTQFRPASLPSLMRKAWDLGQSAAATTG